jgi:SAM-dependent methyltransferase
MHDPAKSPRPLSTAPGPPGLGVPLSVWAASPASEAAQAVTAFSRPGDLVVVLDAGSGAVLASAAAAAAARRVLGLVPGPAACHAAGLRLDRSLDPVARPLAQVRPGGPGVLLDPACPQAGQAALVIASVPRDGPGDVYAACERVLRPGGILAVLTAAVPVPGAPAGDSAAVIAAARAAGLVYAQHVIALRVPVAGGELAPPPGTAPAPGATGARVHADVLVLTKPGGTA